MLIRKIAVADHLIKNQKETLMQGSGFLAIWSDVQPHQETDYLHWLTREHTAERVGIPGFLAVRVFRALKQDVHRFFILYELEGAEVLAGENYLTRLNAPTPWSKRIMPILGNFVRGGGRRTVSKGMGQGGILAPILMRDGAASEIIEMLGSVTSLDRIAAVRVLETDNPRTSIQTTEKQLRQNDASFERLLLVEGLDEIAVRSAADWIRKQRKDLVGADDITLYAHCFGLGKHQLGADP